jgi:hypothetical protein
MTARAWLVLSLTAALLAAFRLAPQAPGCCPAPPSGKPVVNADQTVILLWDAASQTEHFIRQASFKSQADDFGFLVPTPSQPELSESGNEAFPFLLKLTEPERKKMHRPSGGMSCGCGSGAKYAAPGGANLDVKVLAEKLVAGFQAVVLETKSANALVGWLKEHGYAFSPEVEAWAKPYVEAGWKITALRVAKDKDGRNAPTVAASSLRLSFKTDRPLFPYREPDPRKQAAALGAQHRLLRIYFLADARYQGELTPEVPWTGKVAWANPLGPPDQKRLLELLKLPDATAHAPWWLTEFEDAWPYQVAPADVTFSRAADQTPVKRPPIIEYVAAPLPTDVMIYAIAGVLVIPPLLRRVRRDRQKSGGVSPRSGEEAAGGRNGLPS